MSTELKDLNTAYGPHFLQTTEQGVRFTLRGYEGNDGDDADMNKADFIAAVETELNGIFISRDELPEVISGKYDSELAVLDSNGEKSTMAVKADTPESLREIGLAFLAMAIYREKNPPFAVDEGQVKALASLLDNAIAGIGLNDEAARRLISTGKVTVTV